MAEATINGIEFPPNPSGKRYISVYHHRGTRPRKNCWHPDITPNIEYEIFCEADANSYNDTNGHYWGFRNDGNMVLGTHQERLCKFPCPSNTFDPWHGYPVSPLQNGSKDAPSDELVDRLELEGKISRTFAKRIKGRKI